MKPTYEAAILRLYDKLVEREGAWDVAVPKLGDPCAEFTALNPGFPGVIREVEAELDYELSERQCMIALQTYFHINYPRPRMRMEFVIREDTLTVRPKLDTTTPDDVLNELTLVHHE